MISMLLYSKQLCLARKIFTKKRLEKEKTMRILGIDPGFAIVGYGVLDYEGNHFQDRRIRRNYHQC